MTEWGDNMKAVVNGKIVLKNGVLENKVIVFDKKIIDICDEVPTNCEIIDAKLCMSRAYRYTYTWMQGI